MKWQKAPAALVERFGALVPDDERVERRQMFGYPCAFLAGHLFMGLHQGDFLLRLGERDRQALLQHKGARVFEPMAGRPMREYVIVPPSLLDDDDGVAAWIARAVEHAAALPPKRAKARSAAPRAPKARPPARKKKPAKRG